MSTANVGGVDMGDVDMNEANPYSAPESALNTGQDALYTPKIISFQGRIGRMRYLAYSLGFSLLMNLVMTPFVGFSAMMGGMAGSPESMGTLSIIVLALITIVSLVIGVMFVKRRLNDLNRSGWWMLLFIVPVVNLLLIIYLLFFPGTDGANNYGPPPIANSFGVLLLAWLFIAIFGLGIISAIALPVMMGASA